MGTRPSGLGISRSRWTETLEGLKSEAARSGTGPMMRYREHAPHPDLLPLVECYWSVRGKAIDPVSHRVLPDGCVDVLFDLSSDAVPMPDRPEAAVVGFMTRPLPVVYRGEVELFAVRFRPGRAAGFLGVDTHELTDRVEALDDVWGPEGRRVFERLVATPTGTVGRARLLDAALLSRLEGDPVATDALMVEAASRIVRSGGRVRIADLARSLDISRRQLERRFPATVGVSPKTAARIARFRRVVDALHERPSDSLSMLALRQGYADQAHMTREFKALAGRSPGAYRKERLG